MKLTLAVILVLFVASGADAQRPHPCSADAVAKAIRLLDLHFGGGTGEKVESLSIDRTVKLLAPTNALKGHGKYDVLEVWGHVYKADYRMRFIYAQIKDSCTLMGQEILEAGNPY